MKFVLAILILGCVGTLFFSCGEKTVTETVEVEVPGETQVLRIIPDEHIVEVRINGTVGQVELQYDIGLPPIIVDLPYSDSFTIKSGDFLEVNVDKTDSEPIGEVTVSIYINGVYDTGKVSGSDAGSGFLRIAGYLLDKRVEDFFVWRYSDTPDLRDRVEFEGGLPRIITENEAAVQYGNMPEEMQAIWLAFNETR